jgi:poly-gamma-glutamate synthesis protein (capsule biosynthesis protein)
MSNRRQVLKTIAGLPLVPLAGCAGMSPAGQSFRVTLAGQALMTYSLCAEPYPGFDEVVSELRRGDVVFTDLEAAIKTPASGMPTRDTGFLHTAAVDVLDCLESMGFNLLALSNNHAWDLGTEGVLATRSAVLERGFAAAGTGANIAEASAPAILDVNGRRVALVATATEKIRDGAAATETRPGVNELRLADGRPLADDADRVLQSIRAARTVADIVIAYHHNHDWGDDMKLTRPWAKNWAADCVAAGADIYVSHGAPLLHGIAARAGSVRFFGLGSLVFHSRTEIGYYPSEVWETAIAHCSYEGSVLQSVEIVPVVLNERGDDPARQNQTRGRPRIATGGDAHRILGRLRLRAADLGADISIEGGRGILLPT